MDHVEWLGFLTRYLPCTMTVSWHIQIYVLVCNVQLSRASTCRKLSCSRSVNMEGFPRKLLFQSKGLAVWQSIEAQVLIWCNFLEDFVCVCKFLGWIYLLRGCRRGRGSCSNWCHGLSACRWGAWILIIFLSPAGFSLSFIRIITTLSTQTD